MCQPANANYNNEQIINDPKTVKIKANFYVLITTNANFVRHFNDLDCVLKNAGEDNNSVIFQNIDLITFIALSATNICYRTARMNRSDRDKG